MSDDAAILRLAPLALSALGFAGSLALRERALARSGRRLWIFVSVAAIAVVYVVPALVTATMANVDINNFRYTGGLVRSGTFVYAVRRSLLPFHPYLPFQMFIAAAASWLSDAAGVPFALALKLPSILAVAAITALLRARAARPMPADDGAAEPLSPLAFLLNPVVVFIVAYHGQFDTIPLLGVVAAWWMLSSERRGGYRYLSAVALGFAVLSKTWPLVLLPTCAVFRAHSLTRIVAFALVTVTIPLAIGLAYCAALNGSPARMFSEVFGYQGIPGFAGYSLVVAHFPGSVVAPGVRLSWVATYGRVILLFALAVVFLLGWLRRWPLAYGILSSLMAFYVTAPAMALHYCIWAIPFAIATGERTMLGLFTLLASIELAWHPVTSYEVGLTPLPLAMITPLGVALWVLTTIWLFRLLWTAPSGTSCRVPDNPSVVVP